MQLPAKRRNEIPPNVDLVAFSHTRWNSVWGRPQHLMSRWGNQRRVFFVEEPVIGGKNYYNEYTTTRDGVRIVVPHLKEGVRNITVEMKRLIHALFMDEAITDYILWYWNPMAHAYTQHLSPSITVYDCNEEAASLGFASAEMRDNEIRLLSDANIVFSGGMSLHKHKKQFHNNAYAIPDSVDVHHFQRARNLNADPPDQAEIAFPRIGFHGVIDERVDLQLLRGLSKARPSWNFVLLGPLSNIHPGALPQAANIHYLGRKKYAELPEYLSGWNVAMLPFVRNESTRYENPGQVLEYLAAGKPVVSTSLPDVAHPYGDLSLVHIADTHSGFSNGISRALSRNNPQDFLDRVDAFLEGSSWDKTREMMEELMAGCFKNVPAPLLPLSEPFVPLTLAPGDRALP